MKPCLRRIILAVTYLGGRQGPGDFSLCLNFHFQDMELLRVLAGFLD